MTNQNPYRTKIKTLDDLRGTWPIADAAIDIVRSSMKQDVVHEESHIVRVVTNALWFGDQQAVDKEAICVAAILHDLVNVRKDSPNRSRASMMSARKSFDLLYHRGFLKEESVQKDIIKNAIEAHSWTANIEPVFFEAKCVQDADRIESLGALGIARLFSAGGAMKRQLFDPVDPTAQNRSFNEFKYTLDHYFVKMRFIAEHMKTVRGKFEADILTQRMEQFVKDLISEL